MHNKEIIEFWFEFASTYSYPAAMRIEKAASAMGVSIKWKAFLLGPIFRDQGWSDSPFNLYEAKGRYMWRDIERLCNADGIGFQRPSRFPGNGLLAARITCCFQHADWLPTFVRAVYIANFRDDRDISSSEVICSCLEAANQSAEPVLAQAQSPASKSMLAEQTQQAVANGIFGSPSFVVGEELFWGNDRLQQALELAAGQSIVPDGS